MFFENIFYIYENIFTYFDILELFKIVRVYKWVNILCGCKDILK